MPRYLLVLALSTLSPANEPARPQPGTLEGIVTSVVASLLEHRHLHGQRLDDEVSARWFDAFVDTLDPTRMYFLQEDVDKFSSWRTRLDDNLHRARSDDLAPAFEMYDVYRQRVAERTAFAITIADDPMDFTLDETFDLVRDDQPWPATKAEQDELWRLWVKELRLRNQLWGRDEAEGITKIIERFEDSQRANTEVESFDILEMYLTALGETFDPHTTYMRPATSDTFDIELSNSVEGIGAVLRREDEYTKIIELVPGGPAERSGQLSPDDRIIAVAQGSAEAIDVLDRRIDDVVKLIRGRKGSEVRLTIIPAGAPESSTKVVTLVRDRVQLQDSLAQTSVKDVPGVGKVAVTHVPTFYAPVAGFGGVSRVSEDVKNQLAALDPDVKALVLDLRENSGGSLPEAIDLTGLFIGKGPVVQVRGRRGEVEVYQDRVAGTAWDGPLVVLTSPFSASASEIFAGAIQDYGRGVIVGSKQTHGKGTVQQLAHLDEMLRGMTPGLQDARAGTVKLTIQQFYRINGASTQARGVAADVPLPTWAEAAHQYEGEIEGALPWDQVEPAAYERVQDLQAVIPELRRRSEVRVSADEELQQIAKANAWRDADDAKGGVVSLKLEQRLAERAELEAITGEADEDPEAAPPSKDEDRPDPLLDEAIRIALDLAQLAG